MNFDTIRFGDLFAEPQKNGLTRPKKVRGSGFPMVNMGELFSYPRIKDISMDLVPVGEKENHYFLEEGDLLFARQSLVLSGAGQCSIFLGNKAPTVFESHLIRCRLNKRTCNPQFYFYFFRSPKGRQVVEAIVEQGAGASGIRGSDLINILVPNPPKSFQDAAVSILSTLDDRATLLRETNETLEAIAQALFKSWFVDFDPVHGNAGNQTPTLPPEVQAIFPSAFTDATLGPIPKGWDWKPLNEAYEVNPKRPMKKGAVAKYLDMASVQTKGHVIENVIEREFGSGTKFCNGDTLLARITPCLENGKTAFVDFLEPNEVGWGSTEFVVLKPKAPLPTFHGYLLARQSAFREFAIQSMSGTSGRQRIQNDVLCRFNLAVPNEQVADTFAQAVSPIQQRISANHKYAQTLESLRDMMLPYLISGQIRVPEAVQQLE
ncbi:restriction endonuclease subunit S [Aeromonas caviae]|uniref:restriction endonuclease subunit S n=1 Tax=Aeromonas caviae TaxID=648 RepID=UPI002B247AAD|nr:restriction endonuclease subunit S [Aeromonas caviae]MEA9422634.1 restriction endonuclease subunit S [Aeromonas caviae]MEA9427712.1 restriction endonuclease subunit S [Aeromonas caviae]